jgi:site-specific DNA-methyltransferase (adenine-specific)
MKPYFETDLGVLYHGDCLEIMPQLEPVDLVLTDPPYNVGKDYGECSDNLTSYEYSKHIAEVMSWCQLLGEKQAWVAPRYKLSLYLCLMPKAHIVVVRRGARGPYRQGWSDQFQVVLTVGKPNKCEVDLWENIRLKGEGYFFREETFGHPGYTPQPIMCKCVELLSTEFCTILDPFLGSGTTAIACERLNRKWIGIEISEKYCEIAAKRIERERQQLKLFQPETTQTKTRAKKPF